MTNRIKHDVIMSGVKPEMVLCDSVIQSIFNEAGYDCERTSITGKTHGSKSLHPPGYAIDYKTKHITGPDRAEILVLIKDKIKQALPCCDVLLEDLDGIQEHIHAEFDPKNDPGFQANKQAYRRGEIKEW